MERKLAWSKYTESDLKKVMDFAEGYRQFMSDYKTERECVGGFQKIAEENGYKDLQEVIAKGEEIKAGDKLFVTNREKNIFLFTIGTRPISEGLRITGAHIDASRLDLKPYPVYETGGLAYLDTHYYGGMKNYLWQARPLAIHGCVFKNDGTKINVVWGEDEKEPCVGISDLLPHLSSELYTKSAKEVLKGDEMNIHVGSIPVTEGEEKEKVKANILQILKTKYGIEESDFTSAEIQIVPAGPARDYGLDNSMVLAYGHDDRVCGYTSFMGLINAGVTDKTNVVLLVDKEEVGSIGATGMKSRFFQNMLAEIMDRKGEYSELNLRRALQNSKMLSTDVTAAYDPQYPGVYDANNSAYFGRGASISKYVGARGKAGTNEATAEFVAELKNIFDNNDVSYQFAELGKVDAGGGGTISHILAEYAMDVIDLGVPVHSMHAPFEICSKADLYETMRANEVFYKEI